MWNLYYFSQSCFCSLCSSPWDETTDMFHPICFERGLCISRDCHCLLYFCFSSHVSAPCAVNDKYPHHHAALFYLPGMVLYCFGLLLSETVALMQRSCTILQKWKCFLSHVLLLLYWVKQQCHNTNVVTYSVHWADLSKQWHEVARKIILHPCYMDKRMSSFSAWRVSRTWTLCCISNLKTFLVAFLRRWAS